MMKKGILLAAMLLGVFAFSPVSAKSKTITPTALAQAIDSATFKVYGKCGMCKNRIEGAVNELDGIQSANWNVESKMLTVKYDPSSVKEEDIHKQIVSIGHDTDAAYNGLPGCCKYERQEG